MPVLGDFGVNQFADEALSAYFALINWGVLPYAGGWLDQPIKWREDLQTLQAVYNERIDELQQKTQPVLFEPVHDDTTGAEIKLGFLDG